MIRTQNLHILVSIAALLISVGLVWLMPMSDLGYSVLMCANFVWILFVTWQAGKLSPYFFFITTFTMLFIGGRFWAEIFAPNALEFDLRRGNFFNETRIDDALWCQSLTYILLFLHVATIAYISFVQRDDEEQIICYERKEHMKVDTLLAVAFCILAPFTLKDIYDKFITAFSGDGYLSLYLEQTENVSAGSGLIASMLYVFLGIALVYGNKRMKLAFLILMFAKAFVFILIGQRAKFGALLLFFLWYYLRGRKVNIAKVAVLGGASLLVLLWITSLSIREVTNDDVMSPFESLGRFFYAQGVSITTFAASQEIESYPILPYFVSFIPGAASVATLISSVPSHDAAFANYLAYSLNEGIYNAGHGIGWTLLSDLYLYSGRNYMVFILLAGIFGYVCARMENRSKTNPLVAVLVFAVFLNLTFLPRAGLYTVIPLMVWVWAVYLIINTTSNMFRDVQNFTNDNNTEKP